MAAILVRASVLSGGTVPRKTGGKMKTRKFVLPGFGLAVVLAVAVSLLFSVGAGAGSDNKKMRWDIIQLAGAFPALTVSPGGKASADTANGNRITVTGSGTFRVGESEGVSGGGTWATTGPDVGAQSGTFKVTALVSFELAPGSVPPTFIDQVTGVDANFRGGLAVLRIRYSDGSKGVLFVSCHAPVDGPASVFEGITASKGFVDFWSNEAPTGGSPFVLGTNENRTQFHVLPGGENGD
jgi:hypothetical protein